MKPFVRATFERQERRLHELDALLSAADVVDNLERFRQLTREHAECSEMVRPFQSYRQREHDLAEARALQSDADPELAELAASEIRAAEADLAQWHDDLLQHLLPRDADDERPAFLEIRAGTGGDEAALFAADLARMYLRFADRQGWRADTISASPSELGGYKEIVLRLSGQRVYGHLRFESGGHRVQRVPVTESQGRIHTSACTVAVMPEPDEAEAIRLNPAELRIDTFRASGAGGQHINKTDSAVRVVHLPTGLVAECQDGRSQHSNKAKALQVLQARLQDKERQERAQREASERKGLIGSGDRSDRIRTYNFPQGRLTDHRIGLTLYKLGQIMEGDLEELLHAIQVARGAEWLSQLEQRAEQEHHGALG